MAKVEIGLSGTRPFTRGPQFLEGPVQVRSGHQFGGHELRTGDHVLKCRSWKVFRLTSRMLLWRVVPAKQRPEVPQVGSQATPMNT